MTVPAPPAPPERKPDTEADPSRTRKYLVRATLVIAAIGVLYAILGLTTGWAATNHRLNLDFWPPDASRVAPNLLASIFQYAFVVLALVLTSIGIKDHVARKHAEAEAHRQQLHDAAQAAEDQRHAELLASHAETQRHLRHIIDHHPDIPDLPPIDAPAVPAKATTTTKPAAKRSHHKPKPKPKETP